MVERQTVGEQDCGDQGGEAACRAWNTGPAGAQRPAAVTVTKEKETRSPHLLESVEWRGWKSQKGRPSSRSGNSGEGKQWANTAVLSEQST